MKKSYLIMAAIASLALVSCSDEEFVGNPELGPGQGTGAIAFASIGKGMTRADAYGADAAEQLNNNFVVGGFKGATSVATSTVFDNYNVKYSANTANTTESNSSNWEYVGLNVNPLATIYVAPGSGEDPDKQTIKYWDYSQDQYDFIAYSLGNGGATATTITPTTATVYTGTGDGPFGAYKLTGTTAQLKTVHIADLVTVKKADYDKVVNITFRKLAAKVRMAIYETVPGYSVKDVKFYPSDDAITNGATSETATLYTPSSTALPTEGTYTVYFPTVNKQKTDKNGANYDSDANNAHVAFTGSTATSTTQSFGNMTGDLATQGLAISEKYEYKGQTDGAQEPTEYIASTKFLIGRTSNSATYAGTYPYYQDVLPLETGTSLTLKVDYTLISIDGSKETIKVVGAKAVVPAIYAQWAPGYAYTYIFKISDNTNGYTSQVEGTNLAGLHAITFDAAVIETTEQNQETVTTVATPSITTYQHDPAVNASANDEYKAGTIYAMVMNEGTLKTDLNGTTDPAKDAAKLFSLNRAATEAEVMDALLMQASTTTANKIIGRNGLELTPLTSSIDNEIANEGIPGPDGNAIAIADGAASKLTVEAGNTYAYVYTVTQPGAGTDKYELIDTSTFTAGTTDVSNYFTESSGTYTAATGTYVANTKYYAKYTVYTATYAVKVIKVASGS